MSRIARWRRGPDDPSTARGWLFRFDRGPEERRRLAIAFGTLGGALAILGTVWAIFPATFHLIGPFGPALVYAASLVANRIERRSTPKPKEPPEIGDAFEVRLTIRDAHGLRTGSDQGWTIFSQGWVLFEGTRTDFAVTRGESSRQLREGTLTLRLEDGRKVTFSPIGGPPIARQLNRAFNAWEVAMVPEGEAVLPPIETHSEIWAERHTLCIVGLLVSLAMAGFGATFHLFFAGFVGLFTGASCLWAGFLYARRLREGLSASPLAHRVPKSVAVPDPDQLCPRYANCWSGDPLNR